MTARSLESDSPRRALMLGCAFAALVAAPGLEQAGNAQAFNANPTIRAGTVNIDRSTPNRDVITVSSPSAIVDWRPIFSPPPPDPILFLPSGAVALFQSGAGGNDFAILNRIVPVGQSRIRFDGTVISRLQTAAGAVPGGTVVFSSPTGMIIGAKAVFDVGNLLLTTLDPALDANDLFFIGGAFQLGGGGNNPTAAVVVEAGANILALGEGSWVSLVAPRVEQNGSVRVNGSAAYVAAQQVELAINQGLFDINIVVGTDEATAILHTGTTGGPASGGAGDNHVIAMATAAAKDPVTVLLSGNVGYDAATSAAVENGTIILSAGHDVAGRTIDARPEGAADASVAITGGRFTSIVQGRARTDFLVGNTGAGNLTFTRDLTIDALGRARLFADQGFVTRVEGNAIVSAANLIPITPPGIRDVTGGEASISAGSGARVDIIGNATVDASAMGDVDDTQIVGHGTGGRAFVTSDKGTVEVGGNLAVRADGFGGFDAQSPLRENGGNGTGGDARVSAQGGGSIRVGGNADISASGTASGASGAVPVAGSTGTGGTAIVSATGGTIRIEGATSTVAAGTGGDVEGAAGTVGGTGQGGTASILAASGSIDLIGPVAMSASGTGGRAPAGGTGRGGMATVDATDGRVALGGDLAAEANGTGGDAAFAPGGRGGDGNAGEVRVVAHSGATEGAVTGGAAILVANGTGGNGAPGAGATPGGRGGNGNGGAIGAVAESGNGRLQLASLTARSRGTGGSGGAGAGPAGGRGGDGTAGSIRVGTVGGPPVGVVAGRADFGSVDLSTQGNGGDGGNSARGGDGTGGPVSLSAAGAPVTVTGQADLSANGTGGITGATRAPASGGGITVGASRLGPNGPPGNIVIGTLNGSSIATGDAGALNVLGRWRLIADGSAIRIGSATLTATATGTPTDLTPSEIQALNGTIAVGLGNFSSQGPIRIVADGAGSLIGGDIVFNSGRDIEISHSGRSPGALTIDAASLGAVAGRDYNAAFGSAVQGRGNVGINAGRDVLLALTRSQGPVTVSAGRNATVRETVFGQSIAIAGVDIGILAGAGLGDSNTASIDVRATGNYAAAPGTILRAGTIDIGAGGNATLAQTDATTRLNANSGRTTTIGAPATGQQIRIGGRDVTIAAGGSVGNAATTSVLVQATGNFGAAPGTSVRGTRVDIAAGGDAVLASTTATTELNVAAGGMVRFTAPATGQQITVTSADIDVTAAGRIGDAATGLVALQVQPGANQTVLGGTAQGPGYTLTQDEAGRVRGNVVRIAALAGPGSGDLLVRDLSWAGSGIAGGIGAFEIATPGRVRVEGALALTNAAPADRIGIVAGGRVEVIAPGGGIRIRNAAGAPAGTLSIAADHIWATDAPLAAQLLADPNFPGRDDALRTNNGAATPGPIEADRVVLAPGFSLFVQNSGTAVDFAGITVGPGGLSIDPSGAGPAMVYAFGRRLNADGTVTSNIDFFGQVDFNRGASSGYTNVSEFNRCVINNGFCRGAGNVPGADSPFGALSARDVIRRQSWIWALLASAAPGDYDDFSFGAEPLIEEPVTSGADSSLWTDPEDDDEDDDEDKEE